MPEPKPYFAIAIFVLFCVCVIIDANSEELKAPISPIVYGDGSGGFELYWFYPGKNKVRVGNNSIIPHRGVAPSESDRQYCVLTTINQTPPYFIESTDTYIRNSDNFPDSPGDQYSPIRLAVKKKRSDDIYEDLWFKYVHLATDADMDGEIVGGVTNIGVDDLFEIYLALEWLPGTPTAPMIGVNSFPPYYYQAVCPMDDSSFQTIYFSGASMVGAEILSWHSNRIDPKVNMLDDSISYEILFSIDSMEILSAGEIIASTGSDSLTADFDLTQSGYIKIKAINDGAKGGESYSKGLFLDKDKVWPISVQPQNLFLNSKSKSDKDKIVLENSGSKALELFINYDTSLFILSDNSIILKKGMVFEISVETKDGIDFPEPVNSPIIIRPAGDYYPIIIHATIMERGATTVEINDSYLPDNFSVGLPYPNPFNSTVKFNLINVNHRPVQMEVYNLLGKKVFSQIFSDNQRQAVEWDGIDNLGHNAGSGIYFIRFSTGEEKIIRKVLLLK